MKRGVLFRYVPGQATAAGLHGLPPMKRERFTAWWKPNELPSHGECVEVTILYSLSLSTGGWTIQVTSSN